MYINKIALASLVSLVLFAGAAQANLITNGSFEGVFSGSYQTVTAVDSSTIPSWTIAAGSVDWINQYWQASDGTHSLDLAGYYSNGTINQQFATVAGQKYHVTFDLAGNPDQAYDKSLVASAGNASIQFTFAQAGYTKTNMGWTPEAFDFTAVDSLTTLSFQDTTSQNTAWGAALDNVNVSAVPEPGTMMLLGVGMFGLTVYGKRRMNRES